jgi:hypothetical protein
MDNLYNGKIIDPHNVFDNYFLNTKKLYLYYYNQLPNVSFMGAIDGEKAYNAFIVQFAGLIKKVHQYRWIEGKHKKYQFDQTVIVLSNDCLIEFDDDLCKVFHNGEQESFIEAVTKLVRHFREKQKRQPLEMNLIVSAAQGMELKAMEVKRTKLNLGLFYEDDFKQVDEIIRTRLNKKNDKGIVLLHGLPGTGKTTYLRHLIGRLKKRVLFLSPNLAGNLMNPGFIDLLIENPNTVVVIEDAENVIMDRKSDSGSAVSNLLNISDGLLADFLNVQLICTFNSSVTMVDSALMRKGRLIAKYEFGKLGIDKAQQLSNHLGFIQTIHKPMTVAEISNQHETDFETKQVQVIGFRKTAEYTT